MNRRVWVVEMLVNTRPTPTWQPTVGVGLNRDDIGGVIIEWRKKNPCAKFRVRQYFRAMD